MRELTELLELGDLISKPTRQLSLGERMKCELVAALLHRPRVLFLDEPTIGLDVSMQATMRDFIRDYNERFGATVLLTSHYMDDVAALCPRVDRHRQGRLHLRRRPAASWCAACARTSGVTVRLSRAGRARATWSGSATVVSADAGAGGAAGAAGAAAAPWCATRWRRCRSST